MSDPYTTPEAVSAHIDRIDPHGYAQPKSLNDDTKSLLRALSAERAALKARVDAAEAALEAESDWALAQPNAICDPMQDERVKRLVEAAFYEGFLEGAGDGWVNNPRIKLNWKNSRARAALRDMGVE
jgi:hypothetical protein